MPRINSTTFSSGDQVNATKMNLINADIDDIYSTGDDRLKTWRAISGTALRIDIGEGSARVGNTLVTYAGGTDISVTDSASNYVEINSSGVIEINTTGWTVTRSPLSKVTCAGGAITAIADYRAVTFGGQLYTQTNICYTKIAGENITAGQVVSINYSDGKLYKTDADGINYVADNFGFAQNSATTGNDVSVCYVGIDANQSGLTPGFMSYIDYANNGEITETALQDVERPVGFALSATEILILRLPYNAYAGGRYLVKGYDISF